MKIKTEEKGITLIALVITIIVLLILAGVSISLVTGNNGILSRATEAVDTNKKATILEEAEMVLSGWQTDYIVEKTPYEGRSETTTSGAIVSCTGGKVTVTDNKTGIVYEANFSETEGLGEWNEIGAGEVKLNVPVTGVSLNTSTSSVNIGETVTLIATVNPGNASNKTVTWNSDNDGVATVLNGVVTGVAAGTAIITVTTADGGKTAQCTVTVNSSYIHEGEYLVDVVEIGTYVSGGTVNGGNWRVLSKSGNGASGVVKLVSANVPLIYSPVSWNEQALMEEWQDLTEEFENWKKINYVDTSAGCHALGCDIPFPGAVVAVATKYRPLNEIETLYQIITGQVKTMSQMGDGTDVFSDSNLQEVAGSNWKSIYTGLLYTEGSSYYLGGAASPNMLWAVVTDGRLFELSGGSAQLRPVVSLQSGVKVNSTNTGDGTSAEKAYTLTK